MSKRWFTSDFHLKTEEILKFENRPFSNIDIHDDYLLNLCKTVSQDDTIIHIGDLYSFGMNRGIQTGKEKPHSIIQTIPASFINIRGNHDLNNKVKSLCDSMQIHLGKRFPYVICGHYPSYDKRAVNYIKKGYILLCGHVHRKWKHYLDLENQILNINVGIDIWNYHLVSEDELIQYIISVIKLPKNKINTVK